MNNVLERMRVLTEKLNIAAKAYYADGQEIISNYEYDALYDELEKLENETGIRLSDSPTVKVGYEVLSELPKERHVSPMLSLNKTKDILVLKNFLNNKKGVLSWKMDGLTIVLTYEDGRLLKAVTRGDGETGEIVTNNAEVFKNIPLTIKHKEPLVVRGEAVIHYSDFEKVNEQIPEIDAKYKNPRNLCSGSVRQLDNKITKQRNVRFYAFGIVEVKEQEFGNSMLKEFEWLQEQGFETVDFYAVTSENIEEQVKEMEKSVTHNDFPSDGLVLCFDDLEYGKNLGRTAKFPRNAIAFKWKDETQDTSLKYIEWSASRTGLINPIAVFEPVELEGTRVSRASLHNVSYFKSLKLGKGDIIRVFKANMIIPQIAQNLTCSNTCIVPEKCPVCGGETKLNSDNEVETLYCVNNQCPAKHIKKFVHFTSRDAVNIDGFSEATIEKFIQKKLIKRLPDIFSLKNHKDAIIKMEGFGIKSFEKLEKSIELSKKTYLYKVLYGLGIQGIGLANAKAVTKLLDTPLKCIQAKVEELVSIEGVGDVLAQAFVKYFENEYNKDEFLELVDIMDLTYENDVKKSTLEGLKFVITGELKAFKNRSELKAFIESMGGKVTGSVSSSTDYLINNDLSSGSEKNKKAAQLEIPVITEEEFNILVKERDMM